MSRFPKFRPDLEIFEHRGSDGRSLMVVKDPVAQEYYRLSDYEYRFLVGLDGNVSPDSVVNDLGERGFYYSLEDVGQIMEKAAREGLLLGTGFGSATFQSRLKDRLQSAKRSQSLLRLYFLFILRGHCGRPNSVSTNGRWVLLPWPFPVRSIYSFPAYPGSNVNSCFSLI